MESIDGYTKVNINDLTIEYLKSEPKAMFVIEPEPEVFINGLIVDMQSRNLLIKIYEALNEEKKERFKVILKSPIMLSNLFHKMWELTI